MAAIQEMCKKYDAKVPCYKANPHLHEVWGHCSASKLSGPESLALPERKRERGEGKREWLSMIIRPEMPEKGLISHEMRVRDERGTQKERAEKKLKERGQQRIATFSFRKLGRTEVVCCVWVSEDLLPFGQCCHPSPVKGKSFQCSTHPPPLTPLYPQQK